MRWWSRGCWCATVVWLVCMAWGGGVCYELQQYQHQQQQQRLPDRSRSIRGFKNVALSTARGFGKRNYPPNPSNARLPAEWFAQEMSSNGELARLVVDRFLDRDGDGSLTPGELLSPLLQPSSSSPAEDSSSDRRPDKFLDRQDSYYNY